ncbi:MAG: glycogen/starch/alpha-glucan phosphorylase [Acidobacteria bacterium]|nr:glycogen/starch/alpha-glucan phosphorylase [Acidobacteriota bacterium]
MVSEKDLELDNTVQAFQESLLEHVRYSIGKAWTDLLPRELFYAVALAARDRIMDRLLETEDRYRQSDAKRVYYLSMEFLMGRSLGNNLINMGAFEVCRDALIEMGVDFEEVREIEPDAALGNGGLGRLAACFLDSLATLDMPGFGYGINYEYGLFKQVIRNGSQKEDPDHWLAYGTPWEIKRPDYACQIPVYGRIESAQGGQFQYHPNWKDAKIVIGVPHDFPIVGYGGRTVNYLRLYTASSSQEFDMDIFNGGDYMKAVEQKITSETISKVLYPSDSVKSGRELRLMQEYFLVACAIKDIIRRYHKTHDDFQPFASKVAIQLNDTHPTLAIAELMRVLIDEKELDWDAAWETTQATFGYTNHTLMAEALERWPVSLLEQVVPRHLQIIREINRRFLERVAMVWPEDFERAKRMSIITEDGDPQVRMAHLSIVGSHSVNGVSALHTELVKHSLVPDFYQLWPEKFNNKTNGVTQRRWLLKANRALAKLISSTIGDGWIMELDELRELEQYAEVKQFQQEFRSIKHANKERLAKVIKDTCAITVDPDSLFDVHIKRMHEYKRQLLNCMRIIHDYFSLVEDNRTPVVPRTYIFAGKAAPGYWAAKQIIKLINNLGQVINHDPRANEYIKVVFIPDYRVSLAEKIIPAANLSEQISTAGMEASGTGNMKFAMNGALTMGTLDGANIEIKEEVGDDNIFIFGLTAPEIQAMREANSYNPWDYYYRDARLKRVMDSLNSDRFNPGEPGLFNWLFYAILNYGDHYYHLADLPSYIEAQERAGQEYLNQEEWSRKAILNVARTGKFSSDRTVLEYAREIWNIKRYMRNVE